MEGTRAVLATPKLRKALRVALLPALPWLLRRVRRLPRRSLPRPQPLSRDHQHSRHRRHLQCSISTPRSVLVLRQKGGAKYIQSAARCSVCESCVSWRLSGFWESSACKKM